MTPYSLPFPARKSITRFVVLQDRMSGVMSLLDVFPEAGNSQQTRRNFRGSRGRHYSSRLFWEGIAEMGQKLLGIYTIIVVKRGWANSGKPGEPSLGIHKRVRGKFKAQGQL